MSGIAEHWPPALVGQGECDCRAREEGGVETKQCYSLQSQLTVCSLLWCRRIFMLLVTVWATVKSI